MSNFFCAKCGAACLDSETGYYTGCKHYPPDREPTEAEQREKVAAWMIHNGHSTGHGDTMADLLEELEWQWDEALKKQREACEAAMYHAVRKYMPQDFPLDIVSEAILNARVEKSDDGK